MIGDDRNDDKCNLDETACKAIGMPIFRIFPITGAAGLEILPLQNDALPSQNNDQRDDDADGLRERRAERRAGRPKTQNAHKEIVQTDIGNAGDGNKIHGTLAVAQTAKN